MNKTRLLTLTAIILAATTILGPVPNFSAAQTNPSSQIWQLTVSGLVEHPLNLTLSDIKAMPQTTEFARLFCVDFPTTIVAEGNWTGVKLSYLLNQANISGNALKVAFYASDGYSTDLPVEKATQDNIIVAYQKNGAPLEETLRLVVPGSWGYKWISKLNSIVTMDYNFLGHWESSGYSDQADSNQNATTAPATNIGSFPQFPWPASTIQKNFRSRRAKRCSTC